MQITANNPADGDCSFHVIRTRCAEINVSTPREWVNLSDGWAEEVHIQYLASCLSLRLTSGTGEY